MKFLFFVAYLFTVHCVGANPFEPITEMYVNPTLSAHIQETIEKVNDNLFDASDKTVQNMRKMQGQPSAYWIDSKDKILLPNLQVKNQTAYIEGIMNDIVRKNKYHAVTFIVYDLPNRDCKAMASNGELCCNTNTECQRETGGYCNIECQKESTVCESAIDIYKREYIDVLQKLLSKPKYANIRKVLVIEPDSLPNCVTNIGMNGCTELTCEVYKEGITYAINQLRHIPNVFMYLDIGHGGWLGWENNMVKFVSIIQDLPLQYVRGFALNTANYNNIGVPCNYGEITKYYDLIKYCTDNADEKCCFDPCDLKSQFNAANNEVNYAQIIYYYTQDLKFATENFKPKMIIDSGRNGNNNARIGSKACTVWCNINNAKVGVYPTTYTALDYIEGYVWLKTPGESDGCIDYNRQHRCEFPTNCVRYDEQCGTFPQNIGYDSSQPCPPEAGQWFDFQIIQLNK